jgi:hypothetical protein
LVARLLRPPTLEKRINITIYHRHLALIFAPNSWLYYGTQRMPSNEFPAGVAKVVGVGFLDVRKAQLAYLNSLQ